MRVNKEPLTATDLNEAKEIAKAGDVPEHERYRWLNLGECGYPYKFSVVMAVYKVEEYIREAVDSLIDQTIGFEKNVQLIMVDDGSPDNSGAICDEYRGKYPYNIIVIHKENGGVSSARNTGLTYVEGRYVNFLDPDDMVSNDAFKKVYDFFNKNDDQVDVVAIPLFFFEARIGKHMLNYKFDKGTRVIDLRVDYKSVQLHVSSSFFKLESTKLINFDTNLLTAEDGKEVSKILLEKQQLGVVSGCKYLYRKREGENISATQSNPTTKHWYLTSLKRFSLWIYEFYTERLGYIPWYVQFTVMYDIQWKIKLPKFPDGLLTEKEQEEFFHLLRQVLVQTDDKIILDMPHIHGEHKCYLLSLKYGREADITIRPRSVALSYGNTRFHYLENGYTRLDFINLENSFLKIDGFVVLFGPIAGATVFLDVNGKEIEVEKTNRKRVVFALGNKISWAVGFIGEIPIDKSVKRYEIKVGCRFPNGGEVIMKNLNIGKFAPISHELKNSYYCKDGYKFSTNKTALILEKCNLHWHIKSELKLMRELFNLKKPGSRRAVFVRGLYYLVMPFSRKQIWLISDRVNKADDNGEAMFKYMAQKRDKHVRCYFCISKDAPDFERMKKYGKVINFARWQYKFYLLLGAVTVSSHADNLYTNPFAGTDHYYRDLLQKSKYVFLQHGTTLHDISGWLNKYN
ncbi:MAG: bifunctional glycosyltransferase family 2 protein/CDP-glycerol:glycerophosphate glycerophosphotransferase, partial [Clostridiales bacterium]|nr:bifunctional glycosyltransferase family 2 protein/CDP-glycerol:glycerophosphate glycerophosphotransferase [Clostridiales bacterium]